MNTDKRRFRLCLALLLATSLWGDARYPGKTWKHHRPAGWSAEKLAAARAYAGTIKTAAVMIVQNGAVVDEWGDTARKFNCHSMRKSMLSAMYGIHVRAGRINLEKTLADLGIDDNSPSLSAEEKRATIHDLIKARSGIYHAALYETPGMTASKPPRNSHAPGTFWHYNNWDFNTLGTIFEQETKTKIFEEFNKRCADQHDMQDFEKLLNLTLEAAAGLNRAGAQTAIRTAEAASARRWSYVTSAARSLSTERAVAK